MKKQSMYCGVDLHSKKSYFCFINQKGQQQEHLEIPTKEPEILQLLGKYKDFDINYAFEAGGMTRYLHNIVVSAKNTKTIHIVHPLKFKIITESKRKNDKEDSKKLALGLLKDILPIPVHLKSERSRQLQMYLNLRKRMVATKTKIILQTKSILRSRGIECSGNFCSASAFQKYIDILPLNDFDRTVLEGILQEFNYEKEKIREQDDKIKNMIQMDEELKQKYENLLTIPGIGPVSAAKCLSVIDGIERFERADQLSAYFGLIPSENSSGDRVIHGPITKEGIKEARYLLIQAAWALIRSKQSDERLIQLRKKFTRISIKEKNPQKAIVAVARHLSRIIFGVLKHNTPYNGTLVKEYKNTELAE